MSASGRQNNGREIDLAFLIKILILQSVLVFVTGAAITREAEALVAVLFLITNTVLWVFYGRE